MPEAWLELDTALKERICIVLANPQRLVTEAELRKLSEDGRAYSLILGAELKRLEHRLAALDADPASPLGAIAPAFRRVHDFRAHLAELKRPLSALDDRAPGGSDVAAPGLASRAVTLSPPRRRVSRR